MKISTKRARFFITCNGRYMGADTLEDSAVLRQSLCDTEDRGMGFDGSGEIYRRVDY
jgi:hypothetical protein